MYLVKEPEAKWKIRFYEFGQHTRISVSGGMMFGALEGLPQHWRNREFSSIDDAIEFVQEEINQGKVPNNSEPTNPAGTLGK